MSNGDDIYLQRTIYKKQPIIERKYLLLLYQGEQKERTLPVIQFVVNKSSTYKKRHLTTNTYNFLSVSPLSLCPLIIIFHLKIIIYL